MNKKAAIILLTASFAFIAASIILMNTQIKMTNFLGDYQMALIGLQKEEKVYLAYIDNAAKFALAETMKMFPTSQQDFYALCKAKNKACDDLPQHFKTAFRKHVQSFNTAYDQNIKLENYQFKSKIITLNNKAAIELIGTSTDNIVIKKGEDMSYMIKPNFKIQADLDELNELATTSETIAIAFFNDVVNKFQSCSKIDKKTSCFCDDLEINPNEMPEGYKVSIITTAEREELFGGVEYQFKLLDDKNNIVVRERGKQVRKLKGLFGAHEFFTKDGDKLCFPGSFFKSRGYVIDKNVEKGKLYFFFGPANCKGIKDFSMIEFVKDSELGKFENRPACSEIGVKA